MNLFSPDFHFLRPWWFLGLLPAIVIFLLLLRREQEAGDLKGLCDPQLLPHLMLNGQKIKITRSWLPGALALGWLFSVTSLAGPVWQRQPQPVFRVQEARILVLDLSPSMDAADVKPSRLGRMIFKMKDILRRSREGRTGLVVFGGEAHVVVPLTEDVATIEAMLPALDVSIIPVAGDSVSEALTLSAKLLRQGGAKGGEILLLTDGISDTASAMSLLGELRRQGITLSVLGVGTDKGAPVPASDGGFVIGADGKPRLFGLNRQSLGELARAGGGFFSALTPNANDLDRVLSKQNQHRLDQAKSEKHVNIDRWREEGVYLMLIPLLLAPITFRKGLLFSLVLLFFLCIATPASAFQWRDLWLRPDQQAARALQEGRVKEAAELFRDPAWRATAQYRSGNYKGAAESFKTLPDAQYNLGNALARSGRLQEALAAYEKALEKDPVNKDALENKKLVETLLNQQQQKNGKEKDRQAGSKDSNQQGKNNSAPNQSNKQNGRENSNEQNAGQKKSVTQDAGKQANEQESSEKSSGKEKESAVSQQVQKKQEKATNKQKTVRPEAAQQTLDAQKEQPRGKMTADKEQNAASRQDLTVEQWLHQIPDDPSGLLRNKFLLEHQMRQQNQERMQ